MTVSNHLVPVLAKSGIADHVARMYGVAALLGVVFEKLPVGQCEPVVQCVPYTHCNSSAVGRVL